MANSTTLAIALAIKTDSIRLIERPSRLGGTFIAISDDHGIIEVADTLQEAEARIAEVAA
jgi:hypothetical protein